MQVCVWVCVYIYSHKCVYIYVHVRVSLHVCVRICQRVRAYACACMASKGDIIPTTSYTFPGLCFWQSSLSFFRITLCDPYFLISATVLCVRCHNNDLCRNKLFFEEFLHFYCCCFFMLFLFLYRSFCLFSECVECSLFMHSCL